MVASTTGASLRRWRQAACRRPWTHAWDDTHAKGCGRSNRIDMSLFCGLHTPRLNAIKELDMSSNLMVAAAEAAAISMLWRKRQARGSHRRRRACRQCRSACKRPPSR